MINQLDLKIVLDNMDTGVILVDDQEKIIYINKLLTEITGYTKDDISNLSDCFKLAFIDPKKRENREEIFDYHLKNDKIFAEIFKIETEDYSQMKKEILNRAEKLGLRVVSGNGAVRVEGYKSTAFEIYEQTKGQLPDYIAVPTSACGHLRGIFKGFRELKKANLIDKLPQMIIVQSANINPIVAGIKAGKKDIVPALNKESIAEAITSGSPYGGRELIAKADKYNWLAEDVSEEEIVRSQKTMARDGLFVEPASATVLGAVKKLRDEGKIEAGAKVLLMLTGSGLKDFEVIKDYEYRINKVKLANIDQWLAADI